MVTRCSPGPKLLGIALVLAVSAAGCVWFGGPGVAGTVDHETVDEGDVSQIRDRRTLAVTDGDAWSGLWAEHAGDENATPPSVDFEEETVVAAFRGESPDCTGVDLEEFLRLEDGSVLVEGTWWEASSEGFCTERITSPYRIATIPVPEADVSFEMTETTR